MCSVLRDFKRPTTMNCVLVLALGLAISIIKCTAHSDIDNVTKDETAQKSNAHKIQFCNENRYRTEEKDKCILVAEINTQINSELRAFYEYLQLGYYFAHENYHLPHFSKYFLENAKEELSHAQNLMQYQMTRGAKLDLLNVAAPKNREFKSSCEAIEHAYKLELNVTKQIEQIWQKADTDQDVHLMSHLETHFVTEQHESLKKLADIKNSLKRMGVCKTWPEKSDKLAEFQFDQTIMKDFVKN